MFSLVQLKYEKQNSLFPGVKLQGPNLKLSLWKVPAEEQLISVVFLVENRLCWEVLGSTVAVV